VAHSYNPSYSGSRDHEDLRSKSAQTSRPYFEKKNPSPRKRKKERKEKKNHYKKELVEWLK
jgi:hypothetical protein